VIDLHSHILPGVDDGPPTLEGSLELARAAVATGTRTIAATPHVDHAHGVDPAGIRAAVAALNGELREAGIELDVVSGGEIAMTRLVELEPEILHTLTLGDGPYLLVESPLAYATNNLDSLLLDLRLRGHEVLLAHPERSMHMHREPERLAQLVEGGILTSITSASLTGQFGETVRRFSVKMLADGLVHNVASDAHDAERRRPGLLEGFERAERDLPGIAAQAPWFTEEVPAAILAGDPVPSAPSPPRRRRRLFGRR
jgi:protein-tyrosine phosphatase